MRARTSRGMLALAARHSKAAMMLLIAALIIVGGTITPRDTAHAAAPSEPEIGMPTPSRNEPITINADRASRWQQGTYEVWILSGHCQIGQQPIMARGREAVVWINRADPTSRNPHEVVVYLEGGVAIDRVEPGQPGDAIGRQVFSITAKSWNGRFESNCPVEIKAPVSGAEPQVKPAVYQRGQAARFGESDGTSVQSAQFTETIPAPIADQPAGRRVRVFPRSTARVQARWFPNPEKNESVAVIDSGVNMIVDGIDQLGAFDVSTDRLVIWAGSAQGADLTGQTTQLGETPLEIYMEGNIVFRQGGRVIYAERMYYNVAKRYGMVLDAEVLTPVADYEGLLRIKARVLRQLDSQHFVAQGAAVTSSRLGVPNWWLQSEQIDVFDEQLPKINPFTGQPEISPQTGEPGSDRRILATSRSNFIYLQEFPIFYWPVLATDLTRPTFYVNSIRLKNDSVFGSQILTEFNMFQLFGINNVPPGWEWTGSVDYLSGRGLGLGTDLLYEGTELLGINGPYRGFLSAWGIHDTGIDNLGRDRREVPLEKDWRGRIYGQHRQILPSGWIVESQTGIVSDRNFLEEYFERDYDELKDETSEFTLKKLFDNQSIGVNFRLRMNDFFAQTEHLPRLDHYLIGQSVFWDAVTWHAHSSAGYERYRVAAPPTNPVDLAKFTQLGAVGGSFYEFEREGLKLNTRHELDMPFEAGPFKITPYVMGDVSYWGETIDQKHVTRLYGQAGVRASLPMWTVDPTVQSELWNLNGMAHKVVFTADAFVAEANQDLINLVLYDEIDDDSQEQFRRRMFFNTFGSTPDPKFDERLYGIRSGVFNSVSSPVSEVAEDIMATRLGVHQRWQTKRGPAGQERIVDWMALDIDGTFFPKPDRDNFGEYFGVIEYNYRWHLGDRVTILSDGYADLFDDGLRMVTLGGYIGRPDRGNLYVGVRSIEGPVTSNVIAATVNYRMSEKWIATAGATYDLSDTGNIGQNFRLVRVGESFLISLGFNFDASRDNVGIGFTIEPRFAPQTRLSKTTGLTLAPAGAYGLE